MAPPVVVLLAGADPDERLAALRAGAADVIHKPFSEAALLARLRSILRQQHRDADLRIHADTAAALGFAEERTPFDGPARIALLADGVVRAIELRNRLRTVCGHDLVPLDYDLPKAMDHWRRQPGLFVIRIGAQAPEAGLSVIAELQAAPGTCHARLLVVLDPEVEHLIAPVLDMGAHDAVSAAISNEELALRLSLQLEHKRRGDAMRDNLESGLQAAVIDPLTGLYNRRYALNFLRRMSARAASDGSTFGVMVADLDHFKAVNDAHGHGAGDAVLAHVARQMQGALPAKDMIARIGGEEFLIAAPDTSAEEVRRLAGRLCALVRETPVALPAGAGPVKITISIGVALARPGDTDRQQDVEALIEEADRALYAAKSGGRDTVTICRRPAA